MLDILPMPENRSTASFATGPLICVPRTSRLSVTSIAALSSKQTRMPFARFSLTTLSGSFLWSVVLAWFGARVLADQPALLEDPAALGRLMRAKLWWFIAGAGILLALYVAVDVIGRRLRREAATEPRLG